MKLGLPANVSAHFDAQCSEIREISRPAIAFVGLCIVMQTSHIEMVFICQ